MKIKRTNFTEFNVNLVIFSSIALAATNHSYIYTDTHTYHSFVYISNTSSNIPSKIQYQNIIQYLKQKENLPNNNNNKIGDISYY